MSLEDQRIDLIRQYRWQLQSQLDRVESIMLDTCPCEPAYQYAEERWKALRAKIQEIDELLRRVQ